MKYKVGDRVKVIACKHVYGHDNQKEATVTETFSDGRIHRVEYDNGKSWSHDQRCYGPLVAPTLENMPEGTIIENNVDKRKVLFVLKPGLYVVSSADEFNKCGGIHTPKNLKEYDYKIKGQEDIEELTMEEVCEQLGKIIKIKKK